MMLVDNAIIPGTRMLVNGCTEVSWRYCQVERSGVWKPGLRAGPAEDLREAEEVVYGAEDGLVVPPLQEPEYDEVGDGIGQAFQDGPE